MGEAGTVAGEVPGTVYRLRVVLSGISPMIWRQLEVPATLSLAQLGGSVGAEQETPVSVTFVDIRGFRRPGCLGDLGWCAASAVGC